MLSYTKPIEPLRGLSSGSPPEPTLAMPTDAEATNLEKMSRVELLELARRLEVNDADVMTRPELRSAIAAARSPARRPAPQPTRTWLGIARQLVASVVEQGLNLPEAASLIRGDTSLSEPPPPPPPVATVTLARIYAAQGHTERAIRTLVDVLSSEPDHEPAAKLCAELQARRAEERARQAQVARAEPRETVAAEPGGDISVAEDRASARTGERLDEQLEPPPVSGITEARPEIAPSAGEPPPELPTAEDRSQPAGERTTAGPAESAAASGKPGLGGPTTAPSTATGSEDTAPSHAAQASWTTEGEPPPAAVSGARELDPARARAAANEDDWEESDYSDAEFSDAAFSDAEPGNTAFREGGPTAPARGAVANGAIADGPANPPREREAGGEPEAAAAADPAEAAQPPPPSPAATADPGGPLGDAQANGAGVATDSAVHGAAEAATAMDPAVLEPVDPFGDGPRNASQEGVEASDDAGEKVADGVARTPAAANHSGVPLSPSSEPEGGTQGATDNLELAPRRVPAADPPEAGATSAELLLVYPGPDEDPVAYWESPAGEGAFELLVVAHRPGAGLREERSFRLPAGRGALRVHGVARDARLRAALRDPRSGRAVAVASCVRQTPIAGLRGELEVEFSPHGMTVPGLLVARAGQQLASAEEAKW